MRYRPTSCRRTSRPADGRRSARAYRAAHVGDLHARGLIVVGEFEGDLHAPLGRVAGQPRHAAAALGLTAGGREVAGRAHDEGQFAADTDAKRFAFDVWGILLAYQSFSRLLDQPDAVAQASRSFEALLEQAAA